MSMTKDAIRTLVADNFLDNTTGLITPVKHREVMLEVINTMWSLAALEPTQSSASAFIHGQNHNFQGGLQSNGVQVWSSTTAVIVNFLADLPTAVGGVITLLPNTTYLLGANINVSASTFLFGDFSVLKGVESLNITLTYTGTGDLFSIPDANARVADMNITATSGRLFNWNSSSGRVLRVNDITGNCASFGTFTGSGSSARFTHVSPVFSTTGFSFYGTWAVLLVDASVTSALAGIHFDFGTAVFESITIDKIFTNLAAGATFISGMTGSGNITTDGVASVLSGRINGSGTALSGIAEGDARWGFFHNNAISDTTPDLLLSMQGNTVATNTTTISTDGSGALLAAGAWVVQSSSQMSGTAGGRSSYDGGKDANLQTTYSISVAPTVSTGITISAYIAINGVLQLNSRRQGTASAGGPVSITIPWQNSFSTSGYHEVYLENNTSASNILMSSGIARTS
jgi:hypothetical protein